nr:hypothetical protein [Streptomyces sp. SID5468]
MLAPVTVTPAKPLTPSHLKGLLWTDAMFRATAPLADVTYRYSHTTYHPTEQTLGFWEYLDRSYGDADYSGLSEEEIGELYVGYRAEERRAAAEDLSAYAQAVEYTGWVHPASARVLELWTGHYARLGLHDPGLTEHQPPGLGTAEMIARLTASGLGLDQRPYGGPVYLDATRFGLPLRRIVGADGRPNYLACALRELLPFTEDFDEIVLLYDRELDPDYQLLQRVLARSGRRPAVHRVPIGRVPIDGRIASARHGGWRGHTVGALLEEVSGGTDPAALRLGLRLYFIATLGPGQQQSFRYDLLRGCVVRAARLLDRAAAAPAAQDPWERTLDRHRRGHLYVDPYRLTTSLLGKGRPAPDPGLLATVFL